MATFSNGNQHDPELDLLRYGVSVYKFVRGALPLARSYPK